MKELSIFIDESGDFGIYDIHSPFYIISMVFHDQEHDISEAVSKLNLELSYMNLNDLCIHTGPIIRKEEIYFHMSIYDRRKVLNKLVAFIRQINIKYKCFSVEKKINKNVADISGKLAKMISQFIRDNYAFFLAYDVVKIYYDNGQIEVTNILSSVFNSLLPNIEFRKVMPGDYKLFQTADLFCTMELIRLKLASNLYSKSDELFFGSRRDLEKNYLKSLNKKEWDYSKK